MKERPVVRTPRTAEVAPAPKETRRPPPERPRRFVRWIEYAAIVLILGAAAVIGVFMLRGGEDKVAFETFDRHELAEAAKLGVGEEGVGSAALPITPVSYQSHVALRQAGALAVVPITPVSYESHVALRQAGALQ
jgi:hypothetical protein